MNPATGSDQRPVGNIPADFQVMPELGTFHKLVGPIYFRRTPNGIVAGLLIDERHQNLGANIHGGMISTFVDSAFAYAVRYSQTPPIRGVTTSLSIEFMGIASARQWIEAHVEVMRSGKRVVFVHCHVWRGTERIARASAVFQVVGAYRVPVT